MMNLPHLIDLLAQTSQPTIGPATPTTDAPWWAKLIARPEIMMVVAVLFMFLFISRNKKKQEQERKNQLDSVKKGDQIETIGGLIGTVVNADADTVVLKVDETANVKMRFNRRAIHRVIVDDEKTPAAK